MSVRSKHRGGTSPPSLMVWLFEVTDAELAAADQYEQLAAYKRIAATLVSGKQAWVYVDARSALGALSVPPRIAPQTG